MVRLYVTRLYFIILVWKKKIAIKYSINCLKNIEYMYLCIFVFFMLRFIKFIHSFIYRYSISFEIGKQTCLIPHVPNIFSAFLHIEIISK